MVRADFDKNLGELEAELMGLGEMVEKAIIKSMDALERRDLAVEIGQIKESLGLPILDPAREARVVRRVAERSRALGVDEELTRDVIWRIISSARQTQSERGSSDP